MPQVVARAWVPVEPQVAFMVSQMTGEPRLRWDPFIRKQYLIDADKPGKGVKTYTRARVGLRMVSEYSSFRFPVSVGMTMVEGPWFFSVFGGGWRFTPETRDGIPGTATVWKYTFTIRPAWLRPIADRIGKVVLGREIEARIQAFARACEDPRVLDTL
ncbi:SRPBCC family protein [Leucobacter viscericola]|uniref:SRPBCC family protein n=1 Tax=Leucobacter viscericola TaxID=2714935 RepID=A0A6G7XEA2_9MICO|nr:SRPBCC family protein [Leucobacter viscericola]QIK62727.1 SRPBCC family protein [Leucobacter viscericola]